MPIDAPRVDLIVDRVRESERKREPAPGRVITADMAARVPALERGRLVLVAKNGSDGAYFPLADTLDIGRTEGQVTLAEDFYLSPRHARIVWSGTRFVLRDLGSTNGIYLRLHPTRDAHGGPIASGSASPPAAVLSAGPQAASPKKPRDVSVPLQHQDLILVGQQVLRFEVLHEQASGLGPASEHGTLVFGAPAARRFARLAQRTVEGVTRDVYHVRKQETIIGRELGDIAFTEDSFVSRRHAAIRVVEAPSGGGQSSDLRSSIEFFLVDLASSNGTFLRVRSDVTLVDGDQFRIGQQLFRVDLGEHAASTTG